MLTPDPIRVEGWQRLSTSLRRLDRELPKRLRLVANAAADIVVTEARQTMPSRSGRAKSSVRPKSTRTAVRIAAGGTRAPYVPWLDYGGRVGRNKMTVRPFISEGRYLYPAFHRTRGRVAELLAVELAAAATDAGLEVS